MGNKTSNYIIGALLLATAYLVNFTYHTHRANELEDKLRGIEKIASEVYGDKTNDSTLTEENSLEIENFKREIESEKRKALTII